MKLLILEALESLPEGIELEYEAIEGKIAISTVLRKQKEAMNAKVNNRK